MNTVRLGWTLVHFVWQGVLIASLYAAVRRLLAGANARYLLACAALAAMMAAPVVTWFALAHSQAEVAVAPDRTARIPHAALPLPAATEATVPAAQKAPWLYWAVMVWMAGASVLSIRLLGGWLMAARLRCSSVRPAPPEWLRAFAQLSVRMGLAPRVDLRVSAIVRSPVVIGAWRPLVLVPVGMLTGLAADQVEALLIHELAHIRRHDYLVNLLESVAEALLFYHPAVWWVSGHIRAEREHCCDDAAVAATGDLMGYVNALADLAGMRQVRLATVAADGGSLTDRIARLLGDERRPTRTTRGSVLAAAVLAVAALAVYAQETPRPSFQVASIKRNTVVNLRMKAVSPKPGGQLTARNAPLLLLIQNAYRVQAYQVVGGPAWVNTDGYDIEAKPEHETDGQQTWLMLQSLLAERFQLTLHRETRQLPVYSMAGAKGDFNPPAPKDEGCVGDTNGLPPPPGSLPCGRVRINITPAGLQMDGGKAPMSEFVRVLAVALNHPVIDNTGFTGLLDVHLAFTPDENVQGLPAPMPDETRATDPNKPGIFAALQEQMGLKLTSSKGPVEVLVIDRVERPSAN